VISHSLGVMLVQAGAARGAVEAAPATAEACLSSIERVGREALTEVRRVLVLMRDDDTAPGGGPRPGLRGLGPLIRQFEEAGLTIDVEVSGEPRSLPAALDLSAYRILQEGLTNTLKHAGPVGAHVSIRYEPDGIDLEMADDGPADGRPPPAAAAGHGLIGHARAGQALRRPPLPPGREGRGFVVRARLLLGLDGS